LEDNRLELWVWNRDQGDVDTEDVDVKSVYESYKSDALRYLEDVHQAQLTRWGPPHQR
jgi:hypothetical protein